MPLIERKPTVASPEPQNVPVVQPTVYKTAVFEETSKPFKYMHSMVEGAPWSVDYYSQVVGKHSELKSIDTKASATNQSYTKIKNLELKVTSTLSDSYDQATATMQSTGTANMYGNVVPNVDDYFIADSADRDVTIFKITEVTVATASADTIYEVNFMVIGAARSIPDIYSSLVNKVSSEYVFMKNRLYEGNSPLVAPTEYKQILNLKQSYVEILNYIMTVFFSKSNRMMLLPGQANQIYDYSAIEFLFKIVDPTEHNNLLDVVRAPNAPSIFSEQNNIYDALITRNYHMLDSCNQEIAFVRSDAAGNNTFICGPSFFDIDYIVYPKNPDVTATLKRSRPLATSPVVLQKTERKVMSFPEPELDAVSIPNGTMPLIYSVHKDGYYVLSKNFYDGSNGMSALEVLVKDYLKNNTINLNILDKLIEAFRSMVRMDQFYYGPILLLLIKDASRRIYS